jgi:hypothetical protein
MNQHDQDFVADLLLPPSQRKFGSGLCKADLDFIAEMRKRFPVLETEPTADRATKPVPAALGRPQPSSNRQQPSPVPASPVPAIQPSPAPPNRVVEPRHESLRDKYLRLKNSPAERQE